MIQPNATSSNLILPCSSLRLGRHMQARPWEVIPGRIPGEEAPPRTPSDQPIRGYEPRAPVPPGRPPSYPGAPAARGALRGAQLPEYEQVLRLPGLGRRCMQLLWQCSACAVPRPRHCIISGLSLQPYAGASQCLARLLVLNCSLCGPRGHHRPPLLKILWMMDSLSSHRQLRGASSSREAPGSSRCPPGVRLMCVLTDVLSLRVVALKSLTLTYVPCFYALKALTRHAYRPGVRRLPVSCAAC